MVFFVCAGCNETLKKNQVDKHAGRCRQCQAVTCVDCSQTFYGDDYRSHTVCISEAEKYEGSLFKAKKATTRQNPQEAWMCVVEAAAAQAQSAPHSIRQHLSRLCDFGNVPRNQKKFANFVKNSLKIHQDAVIDQMWKHLEDLQSKGKQEAAASSLAVVEKEIEDKEEGGKQEAGVDVDAVAGEEAEAEVEAERKLQRKIKKKLKREREGLPADDRDVPPTEELEELGGEEEDRRRRKKERKEARQKERGGPQP